MGSTGQSSSLYLAVNELTDTSPNPIPHTVKNGTFTILSKFDTGKSANPYPSIFGIYKGTIKRNRTIEVQKLYTYPCAGTGGHSESVRIYGNEINKIGSWTGYDEDGHNITFNSSFTLEGRETYDYVIITGSYPQIHHTEALLTDNGWINCTSFVDANGKEYKDWIPAIRLGT